METVSFDIAWERFAGVQPREGISAELLPLLGRLFDQVACRPSDLVALRDALRRLLELLASPEGRTDENCRTTDFFLCLSDDVDWRHLPEEFRNILADMAGALHDTVSSPDVASNFDSTPEQLLERLSAVHVNETAV